MSRQNCWSLRCDGSAVTVTSGPAGRSGAAARPMATNRPATSTRRVIMDVPDVEGAVLETAHRGASPRLGEHRRDLVAQAAPAAAPETPLPRSNERARLVERHRR